MGAARIPEPREWLLTKLCVKCEEVKPWALFSPTRRAADGSVLYISSYCRSCESERLTAASYPSRGRKAEYDRRYYRRRRAQERGRSRLPVEPFRSWLLERVGEVGNYAGLGEITGVDAGTLRRVVVANRQVTLSVVDRCLTHFGLTISDVYPDELRTA